MDSTQTEQPPQDVEALLAQMEAQEPPPAPGPDAPGATSATPGERAPESEKVDPTPPEQTEPAGAAKPTEPPKPTDQKSPEQIAAEKSASKYAQNQQRLEGGWKQLNERKAALEKTESEYKLREQELTKRQQDLDRKAEELQRPRVTPEKLESTALSWLDQAQEARDEAKRLEDAGDFAGAEAKNREAIIKAEKAREARDYANHLRANPPKPGPTAEQQQAEFTKAQKEWGQKAAIDFPQCFKKGTGEHNDLQALLAKDANLANDPQGIYYASRLIAAERQATRAHELLGKLEAADAKVKKLEAKLAIPGGGAATDPSQKSDAEMSESELEAQLRRETAGQTSSFVS